MQRNGRLNILFCTFILCLFGQHLLKAQHVWSQVKLDRTTAYVGQPIEVRISVYTSTWFTSGIDLGNIKVNGAFTVYFRPVSRSVKQNGQNYAGVELLYHVFPYEDEDLIFPSLSIEVETPPEGDYKGKKKLLTTAEKTIKVKPIPPNFDEAQWLVATGLSVSDHWNNSPQQVKVGDVLIRRISRTAFGTVAELIPPIVWDSLLGVSMYSTRSAVENQKTKTAISASRTESMRYLLEKEGLVTIPEMVFSWYNPYQKKLFKRTLPAVNIEVLPNPDLGVLASVRDSLERAQQTALAVEIEDPTLSILGMSPRKFMLMAVFVILGLYLLYKLIIKLIGWAKHKRQAYKHSEAYYFHQYAIAAKHKEGEITLQKLYRWIDELALEEASIHAFVSQYGSAKMKTELMQVENQSSGGMLSFAMDFKSWKEARKQYKSVHKHKTSNKDKGMMWINPGWKQENIQENVPA